MPLNCRQNYVIAVVLITKLLPRWSHLKLSIALNCRGHYIQSGTKACGPCLWSKPEFHHSPATHTTCNSELASKFMHLRIVVRHSAPGYVCRIETLVLSHYARSRNFCIQPPNHFSAFCVFYQFHVVCATKTHYDSSQVELFLVMFRFLDCIGMTACCMRF